MTNSLMAGETVKLSQNDFEYIKDLVQRGEITPDQAHVMMVRARRVVLVVAGLRADVRRALNAAVKAGHLAHAKKDGHMPETYFHPTFDYLALAERREYAQGVAQALAGVVARPIDLDA